MNVARQDVARACSPSGKSGAPSARPTITFGMIFAYQVGRGGEVQREAHMHVHPEIRGPLMTVGNYLGAANAYVIILTMIAFAIAEVSLSILRWCS